MNSLSVANKARYLELKKIVWDNVGKVRAFGGALKAIKEEKLYLEEYDTWEEFCLAVHDLTPQHANSLIKSLETPKITGPIGQQSDGEKTQNSPKPLQENKKSEENLHFSVRNSEDKSPGCQENRLPQPVSSPAADTPPVELDGTGFPIPKERLELFHRIAEAESLLNKLAAVRGAIRTAMEDGNDPLYRECCVNEMLGELDKVYADLKRAVPFAVCPFCQGVNADNCRSCKGRGAL